jgi:hypothetical protein
MPRLTQAIRSLFGRSQTDETANLGTRLAPCTSAASRMPTTSVDLATLNVVTTQAAERPERRSHPLQDRLNYARGIAAATERDPAPPASAETRFGDAGRAAMGLINGGDKEDKTQILLLCALRMMRLAGPHGHIKPQDMAPLKSQRQTDSNSAGHVMGKYLKPNHPDRAVNYMFINLYQIESVEETPWNQIIAHETTHEKQYTNPYSKLAVIRLASELSSTPVPNPHQPRGIFHKATQLLGVTNETTQDLESDNYHTDPKEILAYGTEAAFMQHEWEGSSMPKPFGQTGDRYILLSMLNKISSSLITDPEPADEGQIELTNESFVYTAEFMPERTPAYTATGQILLHLSDLEKMQASCKSDEVAHVIHDAIENIQDQLPDDRIINPIKDLQTIEIRLKAIIGQLRETHGIQLMVPGHVDVQASDTVQFKLVQQQPLAHAQIEAFHCFVEQESIELQSCHVDSVLEDSGFNHAFDQFRLAVKSGRKLTHQQLLKPIMALAQYLASAGENSMIMTPPSVNVYDAVQTTIAHTAGLNNHAAQKVKIRFDPSCHIIHVPRHCLDGLFDSPGILAKIGLQVVNAQASVQKYHLDNRNLPDPGKFLKVMLDKVDQEKPERKFKAFFKKPPAAVEVSSPSDELARQVFASMVGGSNQYRFMRKGPVPYFHAEGTYQGPQKPSADNHWHTYGDRPLAKSIMNDQAQNEQTREAAALAYRAGVLNRRTEEPFSAVAREFALRANARATSTSAT